MAEPRIRWVEALWPVRLALPAGRYLVPGPRGEAEAVVLVAHDDGPGRVARAAGRRANPDAPPRSRLCVLRPGDGPGPEAGSPDDAELAYALSVANRIVEAYGTASEVPGDVPAHPGAVTWRFGAGAPTDLASGVRSAATAVAPPRVRSGSFWRSSHVEGHARGAAAMRDASALAPAERLLAEAQRRLAEGRPDVSVALAAATVETLLRGLIARAYRDAGWAPGEALDRAARPPLELLDDPLLPPEASKMRPGEPWHERFEAFWHGPVAFLVGDGAAASPDEAATGVDLAWRAVRHVRRQQTASTAEAAAPGHDEGAERAW